MPKMKFKCSGCGKEFEAASWDRVNKNAFCSRECWIESRTCTKAGGDQQRAWSAYNNLALVDIPETFRHPRRHRGIPKRPLDRVISACYLKEARAMLAGKDTRGKNRCTKLEGDA